MLRTVGLLLLVSGAALFGLAGYELMIGDIPCAASSSVFGTLFMAFGCFLLRLNKRADRTASLVRMEVRRVLAAAKEARLSHRARSRLHPEADRATEPARRPAAGEQVDASTNGRHSG
ncbi:MAG: hypothetical protein WD278_19375 [Pirellulales bacterium]